MNADELAKRIKDAAQSHSKGTARNLLLELEGLSPAERVEIGEVGSRVLLQSLLGPRWFDLAARVGSALHEGGMASSSFVRRWAQALIENKELDRAREVLEEQVAKEYDAEFPELYGLIGRIRKQQFVEARRSSGVEDGELLCDAIAAYRSVYVTDPERFCWHGINLIACTEHAKRHGIPVDGITGIPTPEKILADLDSRNALDQWDIGTRAEAYVALGDFARAINEIRSYVEYPGITAFNLGSTLRQFDEIWELGSRSDSFRSLLWLLQSRLTEIENGSVSLSGKDVNEFRTEGVKYEGVFGDANFTSIDWFRSALNQCPGVAKIGTQTVTKGGTGFLVKGSDIVSSWGDELVLITNEHVISETDPKALTTPEDARVRFQANDHVKASDALTVNKVLFTSRRDQLDVTIVRLNAEFPTACGMQLARTLPIAGGRGRVLIVGHPDGADLSFSIADNALIEADNVRLRYRTPTEGGSSGSPVFNMQWKVVGLHHATHDAWERLDRKPGTYEANEGIALNAIAAAARADAGHTS